ncbi:polysaccharide pyruvyl transferase family protein [Rhizobium sp. LjRoot98]|uniref:polysaccharide pyruvyl transferase family protein n=1 Tax=Rhizobium sp. LjRoot98 TaxID=3342345 RepID=UPI003ED0184D
MFVKPVVLGVFSNLTPSGSTVQELFHHCGSNTGNLLFCESLLQNIENAEGARLGLPTEGYQAYDSIVIAAANWLNSQQDFGTVADRIEPTNLPICIVGLGAQAEIDEKKIPVLPAGTARLMKIISERSSQISVRGTFSAEVLEHYGITNVTVTGCPSLLLSGERAPSIKRFDQSQLQEISIGSTRHGFNPTDTFQKYFYTQAIKHNIDIVLQSELSDMYFALGRLNNETILKRATDACSDFYQQRPEKVSAYLQARAKVFFDLNPWLNYMSHKSLYVGTRVHGAIASLLSGTPAVLVCHDSRTEEMAHSLRIPHVLRQDIDINRDLDFMSLYQEEKQAIFEASYANYRATFHNFFQGNGLTLKPR